MDSYAELFRSEHRRIDAACRDAREQILLQVASAMRATGIAAAATVNAQAAEWYERWIAKAVDEQVYLGLRAQQRHQAVRVHGLTTLQEALALGHSVLLAGTHLGPHTLGLVHLDSLAVPMTILVHQDMLPVMPHYGLQHAHWLTPGAGFGDRLSASPGGLFATYADVGRSGLPLRAEGGRFREKAPVDLLVPRAGAVFTWRFRRLPPDDRDAVWELRLSSLTGGPLAEAVIQDPGEWMLWRRVPVPGIDKSPTLGWAGHDRIVHEQHHGSR